ncbi:MAG: helix-turn-helix transcriptional regulator [Actinomycetaceae bacterium]|nr:helix-turn-helix transcriptional regulator [Actinomycetaceae bacterium]
MSDHQTTYVISVAAELAGMHPQTLRQYDRLGIVIPARTQGRGRRYTPRDVERLREVQRLSKDEGVNLEGIRQILELKARLDEATSTMDRMRAELQQLREQAEREHARRTRVFAASADGDVHTLRWGSRVKAQGGELVHIPRPGSMVRVNSNDGAMVLFRR